MKKPQRKSSNNMREIIKWIAIGAWLMLVAGIAPAHAQTSKAEEQRRIIARLEASIAKEEKELARLKKSRASQQKLVNSLIRQIEKRNALINATDRQIKELKEQAVLATHNDYDLVEGKSRRRQIPPPQPPKFLGLVPRMIFCLFTFHSSLYLIYKINAFLDKILSF